MACATAPGSSLTSRAGPPGNGASAVADDNWAGEGFNRKNDESKVNKKEALTRESLNKAKKEIKGEKK